MITNPIRAIRAQFNRSVVLRTTLMIVATGLLMGALAVLAGLSLAERKEKERLYQGLDGLIWTVERTASIAAYTHDARLALEVASGLLANQTIARLVISDDHQELVQLGVPEHTASSPAEALRYPLKSPFGDGQIIGELELFPAIEVIDDVARAYSWFVAVMLIVVITAITLVMIWAVNRHVTRPIKKLSDELQKIDVEFGHGVLPMTSRSGDEISLLASNVNLLISRMRATLHTERELRAAHQAAEQKWRLIFENAETGIFTLSRDGILHDWNPWLALMLGLPLSEDKADREQPIDLGRLLNNDGRLLSLITKVQDEYQPASAEFEIPGEKARWLQIVLTPLYNDFTLVQGIANDITESKRALARAHRIAEQDTLTGLLNRRGFVRLAGECLNDCSPEHALALMLIDLDGFKRVNDTLGHDAGDQLLIAVSRLLESHVRQTDYVVRLGGDEFLVLLRELASPEAAGKVARKIVDTIAQPFEILGQSAQVGASIGIAYCSTHSEPMDELIRRADEAMYQAKNAGKSRFHFAEAGSNIDESNIAF